MSSNRLFAERLALLVLILVVWEAAPRLGLIDEFFISRPTLIAARLWQWTASGVLGRQSWITVQEAIAGFAIGAITGFFAGLVCALYRPVADLMLPFMTACNSLPKLAFAPLLIAWFGFGMLPKTALAASVVFFFIFFGVYYGIRTIDRTLIENAKVLGGRGGLLLMHVYIPPALTWIVSSARLSLAYAFAAAIIAEYFGGNSGLGFLIVYGKEMLNMTDVFAGLVVVVAIVAVIDKGLKWVETDKSRWKPGSAVDIKP